MHLKLSLVISICYYYNGTENKKLQPGPHVGPNFKWINFEAKPNTRNGWVSPGHFKVGFSEGAKVAFPIVIRSYKLIDNNYKTKVVCSLFVGVQYCQITKTLYVCVLSNRSG